ncbi:FG-GAP repeat protein [Haliangium ochraceum]|uniref:Integrin alpha beta-propellor repeat protein n=1 Tax=Haliangium ochraceum (strain DSM 14365 / JCM 11303 / SMP-2) TaxID=502025 RepID=D0LLL6_HALO1|nr:FG-GAP repeat protein [Haliangium ochraceum]ACY13233.1 Integrin alpha beta-propellor repeat protein [Haliangium ochraceum DSM 14365]
MGRGIRCGLLVWVGLSVAGCAQLIGIEDLPDVPADAAPVLEQVRGSAVGLLTPVSLRLEHAGGSEVLLVEADGAFAFATGLPAGASYTVALVDESPCVLVDAAGMIGTATAEIELACESVFLSSVSLSGLVARSVDIDPAQTAYDVDLSILQRELSLTVETAHSAAKLTVAGVPVKPGQASAVIPLHSSDDIIKVVVTNSLDAARTYRFTIRRVAPVAEYAYGKASNAQSSDNFGYRVALWGDTLAVAAPYEDSAATGVNGEQNDNSLSGSGAVYIFRRSGNEWQQEAYLKASNSGEFEQFGGSLALSGDSLAVGTIYESSAATGINGDQADESAATSGAVYVFRRTGTDWQQEAYIKASNTATYDYFGNSVALWGNRLAVGAYGEDSAAMGIDGDQLGNGASSSGAVYTFLRTESGWVQEAYIKASNTDSSDQFGYSVDLWQDRLVVGAVGEDSSATGIDGDQLDGSLSSSGAVYVFRHQDAGWQQEAYIKASNPAANDLFGYSVALDGTTLAVGAYGEDSAATGINGDQSSDGATDSGAVYAFRRNGAGWAQDAYIKSSNTNAQDRFGETLAIWGDTLVVGARSEDSAATSVDGDDSDNGALDSGAAYMYRREETTWRQRSYVKASNGEASDEFGRSVAVWADTVAVGAEREDGGTTGMNGERESNGAYSSGAVYIFH